MVRTARSPPPTEAPVTALIFSLVLVWNLYHSFKVLNHCLSGPSTERGFSYSTLGLIKEVMTYAFSPWELTIWIIHLYLPVWAGELIINSPVNRANIRSVFFIIRVYCLIFCYYMG